MKIFESEKGQKVLKIIKLVVILATVALLAALGLYMLLRHDTRPAFSPGITKELLEMKLGPLQLGQSDTEVRAILGEPDSVSDSGEVIREDGSSGICWFYRTNPQSEALYDVSLTFRDTGSGSRLDAIMLLPDCTWTLPNGIGIGTGGKEVDRLCENYAVSNAQSADGTAGYTVYSRRSGDLSLDVVIGRGKVVSVALSGFHPDPQTEP